MAEIAILNVGDGDTKLTFDKGNPAETIRAGRIIRDMLRRGYALLVEVERDGEKRFERALDFDEKTSEYIITDFDSGVRAEPILRATTVAPEGETDGEVEHDPQAAPNQGAGKAKSTRRKRIDAHGAKAVSVGRSAGG